jgi:hypothetical protein
MLLALVCAPMSERACLVRIACSERARYAMSQRPDHKTPDGLDDVVRRLREERPELGPLELDTIKTKINRRTGAANVKGARMRGRAVIAVLALSLLGAGAGGVVAASGISSSGASSATAQYKPPKCPKHTHYDKKNRKCVSNKPPKCPKHTHFGKHAGRCVSNKRPPKCPKGTHHRKGKCVSNARPKCPKSTHWNGKVGACVSNTPPKCKKGFHRSHKHHGYCVKDTTHHSRRRGLHQGTQRTSQHSRTPRTNRGFTGRAF